MLTILYQVCPESIVAIQGALGTVCEAVDTVVASSLKKDERSGITRAFVAIRPPGHHCGEDTPEGFCFVNNVAVAAAHGMFSLYEKTNKGLLFSQPTFSMGSTGSLYLILICTMVSSV